MEATAISAATKLFAGGISPEMGEVVLGRHLEGDTCAERSGDPKRASDAPEKSDRVTSVDVKNRETSDHLKSGLCRANSSLDKTPNKKNIFVCGVPQSITDYELRTYFKKFGTVTDVFLMQDHITNHPEEIGFITFDSDETACEVLKNQFHELNGKIVEVRKAVQDVDSSPRNINLPQLGNFPSSPRARLYPVDGKSDGPLPPFSSAYSSAYGGPYRPHCPVDISGIGYPHPYYMAAHSYAYNGYYGSMGYGDWYTSPIRPHCPIDISGIGYPHPYYMAAHSYAYNGYYGSMGYGDWYTSPISIQNHPYSSHNNNIISSNITMNFGGQTGDSGVAGSANEEACQTAATEAAAMAARQAGDLIDAVAAPFTSRCRSGS